MERDLLSLNLKDPLLPKEEFQGVREDSGFTKSSGVPWPWLNKPSSLPQLMTLKCKDEKLLKKKPVLHASHACLFEAMHKQQPDDVQNLLIREKQNRVLEDPLNENTMHHFSMTSSFSKNHYVGSYHKFEGANMKQNLLGGPSSALHKGGVTEQGALSATAQLTIFYGGAVNVFDNITPEKAQALIFLTGNDYVPSHMAHSLLQGLPSSSMLPNTLSVPSHMGPSIIPLTSDDVIMTSKARGMSVSFVNKNGPPRVKMPIRSIPASAMILSAVPQARKASLARFLQKRRDRAANAAPYNPSKNNGAGCATSDL